MPIYLKNSDLLKEVLLSKEKGKLTPLATEMFIKIANESSRKLKYKDPLDREDCIAGAIEDMIRYWDRFDVTKSTNAFAYYTQLSKNGMGKTWKKLHPPDAGQMMSISSDGMYNI